MIQLATRTIQKAAAESFLVQVDDFDALLEAGDTITGTPTVVPSGDDSVLTATSVIVGADGRRLTYRLSAGTTGARYAVAVTVTTVGGDTFVGTQSVLVVDPDNFDPRHT